MATQNLKLYRGVTYDMSYTHTEAMTGGSVYFTVKTSEYDSDADDSDATIKKDITSFTEAGTKASWTLTDADMFISPTVKYHYSLVYEAASGDSLPPIFTGKIEILPHPTNRNVP